MADPTLKEDIIATGPREVQTPNMRVVAHDPEVVDRIQAKRRMTRLPTMGTLGGSIGTPKCGAYDFKSCQCNEREEE